MKLRTAVLSLILFALPCIGAENAVRAGQFTVEPPTLMNLGFEWEISGDDNRDARVEVSYRKAGTTAWSEALPLLRIGGERVFRAREHLEYTVPHMFAGSILNLEPGTEYECRFTMSDPDGVEGQAAQTVRVRTRTEPKAAAGGRTLHVYPVDWKGEKQEPSFTGLMQAYYGSGMGDWNAVHERKAKAGDVILVHAGLYKANRLNYVDPLMTPFDGTYAMALKGTAEKPIVIRSAGDGEVIFDGAGGHRLFDVTGTAHHIFEGLTFKSADVVFFAGTKYVAGAVGLTVRNCRFEDVGIGVTTEFAGSKDFYIADNVFLGRDDRFRLIGWSNPGIYGAHDLKSYFAVKVYGSGHVIAHNAIAYFHDAICISTYGTPETEQELKAVAIDIYNNDMHMTGDDFIEADGGVHNIRVMRNRGVNSAHGGLSAQPVFGGPAYFIGNIVYNVPSGVALKFTAKPAGLLVYHNTFISEHTMRDPHSNTHFRNNLFLGRDAAGRPVAVFAQATAYSSNDYNGFRPNPQSKESYVYLAPQDRVKPDYEPAKERWRGFATLEEFRSATGREVHGIEVDYGIFEDVKPPDAAARHAVYHAEDMDFRLKAGSKAVDAGMQLPTVNDGFAGRAPDLGALESGRPLPVYGPRPGLKHPFYR